MQCSVEAPSEENGPLVLKRPELPEGFQGKVFKGRLRGVRGVTSSWTLCWLAGGEGAGVSVHNLLAPAGLGSACWWAARGQRLLPGGAQSPPDSSGPGRRTPCAARGEEPEVPDFVYG